MQLGATGDFYFDDIKIVPRVGGFKKRINSKYFENSVVNIGSILEEKEWTVTGRSSLPIFFREK